MKATLQVISDYQITEVADQAYADYKDDFIHNFKVQLKQSIQNADKQFSQLTSKSNKTSKLGGF